MAEDLPEDMIDIAVDVAHHIAKAAKKVTNLDDIMLENLRFLYDNFGENFQDYMKIHSDLTATELIQLLHNYFLALTQAYRLRIIDIQYLVGKFYGLINTMMTNRGRENKFLSPNQTFIRNVLKPGWTSMAM